MTIVNENELRNFNFTAVEDTTGLTIGAYITPESGGSTITVGTTSGGAADIERTIACDFATSGVTPGTVYVFEVIADVSGTNPKTILPDDNSGRPIRILVDDRSAIT